MNTSAHLKIGIIGIGLIGSSLAQALKKVDQDRQIVICDQSVDHLEIARDMDLGTAYTTRLSDIGQKCDLIFLCIPVRSMGDVVKDLAPYLKPGAIITDVGSVKSYVIRTVEHHIPADCHFIPGHPVAGLETSGPDKGYAELFENRSYVLTPSAKTDKIAIKTVRDVLSPIGVHISELDPESHDKILGFTSHFPHIIAFSAMLESEKISQTLDIDVSEFNGGSYEDMTRVATADMAMWRDIFLTNSDNLENVLQDIKARMDFFIELAKNKDVKELEDLVEKARELKIMQNAKKKRRA